MRRSIFFAIFGLLLAFSTCEKPSEPTDRETTISLEPLEIGVSEVWLKLTLTDLDGPRHIELLRDGETIQSIELAGEDTLLVDDDLVANHIYNYVALRHRPDWVDSSPTTPVRTLDTTSHDITWEVHTFGDGNSSTLRDVVFIDAQTIWAVGDVYLNDSTGQLDQQPQALGKYHDGKWTFHKVEYYDYGAREPYPGILNTICVSQSGKIHVVSFANLLTLEGMSWTEKANFATEIPFDGQAIEVWADKADDIYCTGLNGALYHYRDPSWSKLETGTSLDINDIWGSPQGYSGRPHLIAVAGNQWHNDGVAILRIANGSVELLATDGLPTTSFLSIWSANGGRYYICGDGLYTNDDLIGPWENLADGVPSIYTESVRGNGPNDVFVVGHFGLVLHWNGSTWHNYIDSNLPAMLGVYMAVEVKGNTVAAVGYLNNGKAIALIGRR